LQYYNNKYESIFQFCSPPEFRQNKKRSKRRIPPQTPPPPLATSEFRKKESAEVLRNPFPRKLFPQNFVRIVSDFLVGIHFKKGSNFVQNIPPENEIGFGSKNMVGAKRRLF
jgi:hypothetical protein